MKTALFLVGLLAQRFEERRKETDRIAKRWQEEFDEYEASLPEPEERTTEQWLKYVDLAEERYYSMAAQSGAQFADNHVGNLLDALKEQTK